MFPYWLLFIMWAAGALQFSRRGSLRESRLFFWFAIFLTTLMIGLRYLVGGDWGSYVVMYQDILFQPFAQAMRRTDSGYAFLNWLSTRGDLGMGFVNLACATIFMAGLGRLASRQPNPWLAMLVAVPYFIIVVAMGYTRQAAAIGFICWAVADIQSDRLLRLVVLVGVAALFHKTAILFLPILLAPAATRNPILAGIGAVSFALLFNIFLGDASDKLVANYANSNYSSQGATIRVGMNVLAASTFIVLRRRLGLDDFARSFWTICAMLAFVSVVALQTLSASSGVDRLALFLIPLQVVTLSRLPYALSQTARPVPSALLAVLIYSFSVQFVWLNFADNASSWVPYRTMLSATEDDGSP